MISGHEIYWMIIPNQSRLAFVYYSKQDIISEKVKKYMQ